VLHKTKVHSKQFEGSIRMFDIRIGPSWWKQKAEGSSTYIMHCEVEGIVIDLTMNSLKPPLLVGGTGEIKEGLLGRSCYYAHTRLEVQGTISLDDWKTEVAGSGWIDRQWGCWEWSGIGGWKWFSIQLNDAVEMLVIQISHPISGGIVFQSFNVSDIEGRTEVLESFSVRETARWKSPLTKVEYGVGWSLNVPDSLDLRIIRVLEDQEIERGLWEGDCRVDGSFQGREVTGRAYVEQFISPVSGRVSKKLLFLMLGSIEYALGKASLRLNLVETSRRLIFRVRQGTRRTSKYRPKPQ
jgi:predicted secreted hydrolase